MPASTPAPPVGKPVILVVEDEPGIADTLHYVLASDGFEPLHCASAREAVERFAARAPDLAILDVGLPDMNGFELFRQLQALPGGKRVPMLFLTARSAEIDRVVGLELGADDYVAKPFSPRELVARVRTILRRSQRGEAAENAADSKEKPTSARLDTAPTAIENEATRPTRWRPEIPGWLENLLLKAVAKDARDRFETAEEFLLALERGARRPVSAPRRQALLERNPAQFWKIVASVSLLLNLGFLISLLG